MEVRSILQSTAMDLGPGGRDNTFGSGLVDTGLAVRRAFALFSDPALANLGTSFGSFNNSAAINVASSIIAAKLPPSSQRNRPSVRA